MAEGGVYTEHPCIGFFLCPLNALSQCSFSMLFAATVFKTGGLEKNVRILMILRGVLSLAGLTWVPLANMNIRNIGILGYAGVSMVVSLLLGIVFGSAQQVSKKIR